MIQADHSIIPTVKTIALDWLEIAFKQSGSFTTKIDGIENTPTTEFIPDFFKSVEHSEDIGDFRLVPDKNLRTSVFSRGHRILLKGSEIGQAFHTPYNTVVKKPDDLTIKINNQLLYSDWFKVVRDIATAARLKLHHIQKLDVACDGVNFLYPARLVKVEAIEMVGTAFLDFKVRNKKVYSFVLGSRSSDRFARCYNKQREIEEHSKKHYIQDFWKHNGVKESEFDNMERLEISMKTKEIKRLQVLKNQMTLDECRELYGDVSQSEYYEICETIGWDGLHSLTKCETLVSICKTEFKRLYEFRDPVEEGQNVTNKKITRFEILWHACGELIEKINFKSAKRIRSVQTAIKTNYQLYLKTGRGYFSNMADELILNCGLEVWFQKRKRNFDYEYHLCQKYDRPFLSLYNDDTGHYVSREFAYSPVKSRGSTIF